MLRRNECWTSLDFVIKHSQLVYKRAGVLFHSVQANGIGEDLSLEWAHEVLTPLEEALGHWGVF